MSKGFCLNVRGLTDPKRQAKVVGLLKGMSFALLTEIKNKFELKHGWSTFCSDCSGQGGAAICLNNRTFNHPRLVHSSKHAVSVSADGIIFISLYVPCRSSLSSALQFLSWIPDPPSRCVIGGDWNNLALSPQWMHALESKGLQILPNPLPFARFDGARPGASLDQVASSCPACVTHIQANCFSDHLTLFVRSAWPSSRRAPVPSSPHHLVKDQVFIEKAKLIADKAAMEIHRADSFKEKCRQWDLMKVA